MMFMEQNHFSPFQRGASLFVLPELFPEHIRLLLDTKNHTVILLSFHGEELASFHASFQLTPFSTRVFEALLYAYPAFCSYQSLFLALYPVPKDRCVNRKWDRDLALRPIRRAIFSLTPVLQHLGLCAVSLRGQGYLLVAQTPPFGEF